MTRGVLSAWFLLLRPKRLSFLGGKRSGRGEVGRGLAFLLTVVGAGGATYLLGGRLLRELMQVPEIGPLLASKLLGLGLLLFLSLLLLANVIGALSAFFLARDLPTVLASPVDWLAIYLGRATETLVSSSWMVLLLLLPLLAAYQTAYDAAPSFYLVASFGLVPFLVIPAALGSAITVVLVRVFPARRTRDLLAIVGGLAVALLVLGLRALRPERLVRPEGFRNLVDFLAVLEGPSSTWVPSSWLAEALRGQLVGHFDPFWLVLLWTTAGAAVVAGAALHHRLYAEGFTRAQEGSRRRRGGGWIWHLVERTLRPLGVRRRELVVKDLRVFFRDPVQWSQLLILGVLLFVYVYNIRVLPVRSSETIGRFLVSVVVLLNLGLSGFVLAAVAARFVFPAFSLEGPALWLLRSSPLPPEALLWSKMWTGTAPLVVLALALTTATNLTLGIGGGLLALSVTSVVLLTISLVAQALAWGAVLPKFETENAAEIPTSLGGLLFMTGALATLGAVLLLQFWSLRPFLSSGLPGRVARPLLASELLLSLGATTAVCLLSGGISYAVARRQVNRLGS